MSTVNQALDQDRDVFAVPGNADTPLSEGPNRLIQQGAKLVLSARDIFREYEGRFPRAARRARTLSPEAEAARLGRRPAAKKQAPPEKIPVDKRPEQAYIDKSALTDDQVDILLALEDRSLLAEDLIEATRLPAKRVLTALTLLQVQGYVAEHPGKRFQALARLRMD